MSKYHPYKGDPEKKLVVTADDFSGGINLIDSDDLMENDNFRFGLNLDLDKVGDLDSRKGWGESGGLNGVFDLIKDTTGFPKLGFDPVNQLNKTEMINNMSLNVPTYIDVKYFTNSKTITAAYGISGTATSLGMYEFSLVYVNNITSPTEEAIMSNVGSVEVIQWQSETAGNINLTPIRDAITGDTDHGQMYAALKINKVSGGAGGNAVVVKFTQGIVSEFKDTVNNILLFKLIHNPNNLWERITDANNLEEVLRSGQTINPLEAKKYLQLLILTTTTENKVGYFIASVEFDFFQNEIKVDRTYTGVLYHTYSNYNKASLLFSNAMDVTYGYSRDRLFVATGAQDEIYKKSLSVFKFSFIGNSGIDGTADKFTFVVEEVGGPDNPPGRTNINKAYKPSPLEIRRVGFNVLGDNPLTWIDDQSINTKAIQGVYITTEDDIPINLLPMGKKFKVNIIFTGTFTSDFVIKFHEMKNEEKIEITTDIATPVKTTGLHSYLVTFTTQPNSEVEIELSNVDATAMGKYRDYYYMGQVDPRAKTVSGLDIAQYSIAEVWDRFVYFRGDTMWYSDVGRYDYIPNLNYITLPLSRSDEITSIIFFRNNYIIFTKEKIFKMVGHFESPDLTIDLVNDTIGCIASNSIQILESKLYFLSNQGLYTLTSETFRQDLENVKKMDAKIGNDVIPKASYLYSYSTDNQYVLMLNESYTRDKLGSYRDKLVTENRDFEMPDVIRYYAKEDSFIFDKYEPGFYPKFVSNMSGRILGWLGDRFYVKGNSHTDFGNPFEFYLETSAVNFGFPSHEKKYKQLMLKLGRQSDKLNVEAGIFVDGVALHDDTKWATHLVDDIAHENSRFSVKRMRIPSLKGKNIAITLKSKVEAPISLKALSYTFKLGKMRE